MDWNSEPLLLKAARVRELLGIGDWTMRQLVEAGALPRVRPTRGGYGYYRRADVRRLYEDGAAKPLETQR